MISESKFFAPMILQISLHFERLHKLRNIPAKWNRSLYSTAFFGSTHSHKITPAAKATTKSATNALSTCTGSINEVVPTTKSKLKTLLPIIFPSTSSDFPFLTAVMEVNNSGREVPSATTVRAIKRSLSPTAFAKISAALINHFTAGKQKQNSQQTEK